MFLGGLTSSQISTVVWSQATRSLTNMGFATIQSTVQGSIAANGGVVNVQPAAGKFRIVSLIIIHPAGGAGNCTAALVDGTSTINLVSVAPNSNGFVSTLIITNALWLRLTNSDNTNAVTYTQSGAEYTV